MLLMGGSIIVAIIVTFLAPFDYAVKNASTFVNGITTSIGIISAIGASMNSLMFHQVTKDQPKIRSVYFEIIGFYFIPILEAGISYVILATSNGAENLLLWSIRTAIAGFFTALLVSISFYLVIASELKKGDQIEVEEKDEKNETKSDIAIAEKMGATNNDMAEIEPTEKEKQRDKLIYDIIVDRHAQELQRTNDLDSKANNVTGFSGVLATLIAAISGYLPNAHYPLLFIIPLTLLIISAILGLFAYRVKIYSAIEPIKFIDEYKNQSETNVLREYTATIAQNTMNNHKVHEEKANLIAWAFGLMVLAISLFFVFVIINWII